MGEVWAGHHTRLGVPVAIKVLSRGGRTDQHLAALQAEIRAAAALDHPAVVWLVEAGQVSEAEAVISAGAFAPHTPWLAMERIDGGTLTDHLGRQPWPVVARILDRLLDALAHAHARGVLHRDIKPSNVLVAHTDPTDVRLSDFGLAVAMGAVAGGLGGAGAAGHSLSAGTPGFVAPEQIRGELRTQGPWTDLYALGALAWALVTGHAPFYGATDAVLRQQLVDPLPSLQPRVAVPAVVEAWLLRLLARDPRSRYRRAADARRDLAALMHGDDLPHLLPDATAPPAPGAVPLDTFALLEQDLPADLDGPDVMPVPPPVLPDTWTAPPRLPRDPALVGLGVGLFDLRAPPLLGRRTERDALWDLLLAVQSERRPRCVLLEGAAGTGRTALAEWLAHRSHELGATSVFRASYAPDDPSAALRAMIAHATRSEGLEGSSLLAHLSNRLASQGEHDPAEAGRVACFIAPAADPSAAFGTRDELEAALNRIFLREGDGRMQVVVLDEVQWRPEAAEMLLSLLDGAHTNVGLAVMVANTQELAELPEAREALDRLARHPRCARLDLAPLDAATQRQIIGQRLAIAEDLVVEVEGHAGTNPQLAVQLVGSWLSQGLLRPGAHGFERARPGPLPGLESLTAVWTARTRAAVGDAPHASLVALAALGHELDPAEWQAVVLRLGDDVGAAAAALRGLLDRALLVTTDGGRRWTFACPAVRATLLSGASPEVLGRVHAAVAEELAGRGANPSRIGQHLLAAGRPEDAAHALLGASAAMGLRTFHEVLRDLALAAQALTEFAGPDDVRWPLLWGRCAGEHLSLGRQDTAATLLDQALAHPAAKADKAVHARLLQHKSTLHRRRGETAAGLALAQQAVAEALASGNQDLAGGALRELAHQRLRTGDPQAALAALTDAAALPAGHQQLAATVQLAGVLGHMGRFDAARQHLDAVRADVHERGGMTLRLLHANAEGEVLRLSGDNDGALRAYLRSLRLRERMGSPVALPHLNMALCHLDARRDGPARQHLHIALGRARHHDRPDYMLLARVGLALVAARGGAWEEVEAHVAEAEALGLRSEEPDLVRLAERAAAELHDSPNLAARLVGLADTA